MIVALTVVDPQSSMVNLWENEVTIDDCGIDSGRSTMVSDSFDEVVGDELNFLSSCTNLVLDQSCFQPTSRLEEVELDGK